MKLCYIAAPFFNATEINRIIHAETILQAKGITVFSPRNHQDTSSPFGTLPWQIKTFSTNLYYLNHIDFLFAIYDDEDAGTMWEIGYAYAIGKPIILFSELQPRINLMIAQSIHAYLHTWDQVQHYNFRLLPRIPYQGPIY
ncbi:nucleoside 2-deoxyribosyltransferase [Microbacteriaceae bacterium 4G12]